MFIIYFIVMFAILQIDDMYVKVIGIFFATSYFCVCSFAGYDDLKI
jgi:hypothetical protein